jgi:hypothetical protein
MEQTENRNDKERPGPGEIMDLPILEQLVLLF